MQDWLTVIIVLLILGILLDGIRRMRAHRRNALRMSPNVAKLDNAPPDSLEEDRVNRGEFPSGGARVAARRDPDDLPNVNQHLRKSYVASKQTRGSRYKTAPLAGSTSELAEPVVAPAEEPGPGEYFEHTEPVIGDLDNLETDARPRRKVGVAAEDGVFPATDETSASDARPVSGDPIITAEPEDTPLAESWPEAPVEAEDPYQESSEPAPPEEPKSMPDEVMIINVMAKGDRRFAGAALLQAMLDQGLRFGDMDIFHRFETPDGQGAILFSVANMVVPGTFDLATMEEFDTPGISMFLSLPIKSDSLQAYTLMVQAAQAIAHELDGELKDEHRSVMTRQTLEHERQRVIEYDRKRRLNRT